MPKYDTQRNRICFSNIEASKRKFADLPRALEARRERLLSRISALSIQRRRKLPFDVDNSLERERLAAVTKN